MAKARTEQNAKTGSVIVRIRNARLSFPALFTPRAFDNSDPDARKTYSATLLLPKKGDAMENAKLVNQGILSVLKVCNKGLHPGRDRVCLHDGDEKAERGIDGYKDVYYVACSNVKPPLVVAADGVTPLKEQDGKPYAGCYVNATIQLWFQNNKFGKRVNAQLRAVQFLRDGEPFGDSSVDASEEFDDETSNDAGFGSDNNDVI